MPEARRVVLVTGAGSGIGAAVCRRLAGPGVAVLVHVRRNRAGAEQVADAVRAAGGEASVGLGDLTEPAAAAGLVSQAVERFGALHVLVSNAGFAERTPLAALTDDAFRLSVEAMQGAFFRLARAALPHLRAASDARIVAVSSFVAHAFRAGLALFPASAAAKAGLEALVRALAVELGRDAVTVNAVVPGFTRKDAGAHAALAPEQLAAMIAQVPLGRIGLPDDVAAAIAFLASPEAGYITGQLIHVSGGLVI
ncbi:MAG: SDR family oxidoreductase [Acidisphaera sp.]|nr:SDR family oxidoreductase [Acidisphaera sp.]